MHLGTRDKTYGWQKDDWEKSTEANRKESKWSDTHSQRTEVTWNATIQRLCDIVHIEGLTPSVLRPNYDHYFFFLIYSYYCCIGGTL
jgi:hypothetical protein